MKPLEKIQAAIKRKGADAFLVTQPDNRRYLSGYTAADHSIAESSGVLLIPGRGIPFLLTDSRYLLQAEAEVGGFEVVLLRSGLFSALKRIAARLRIRKLAFESHYLLHATAIKLIAMGKKQGIELLPTSGVVERLRVRKSAAELQKIQRAVIVNESVFQEVFKGLQPGQTEREVARKIESAMVRRGAEGPAFPPIVAGGPNGALPHAVPMDRAIKKGEPIIIDMGLKLDGYCSDMTRTVVLGTADKQTRKIIRIVRRAQRAAIKNIKAGILARDVDRVAREEISRAGYGNNFGHGLGHGVGLAVHEAPSLNRRQHVKLQPGMVVTVEPGIYIPGWGGVRLENMVVVEENGCTVLNRDKTFLDL